MAIPSHPKLDGFEVIQATYKQIGDHGIRADILVPQRPHPGKRPVIVQFHGGGLIVGDSLFMDMWCHWVSDLALLHGAVIVSPNYRLMPEATSVEIYNDIEDFWTWLHSPALKDLLTAHSTPTELDLARILVSGQSAGGLLSINLALAHPAEIRAVAASYPWVDPNSPDFTTPRADPPMGQHTPESVIQDTMASVVLGTAQSSIISPPRLAFMFAEVEYGLMGRLYERGTESLSNRAVLYPMERLEQPDIKIPRGGIAIIHGAQDSVVPLQGVEKFVARTREVTRGLPGSDRVILTVRDGEHGFDIDARFEEPWLQNTFTAAVETWLA